MMENFVNMFGAFDLVKSIAAFMFLVAMIDPLGSVPVLMTLQNKGVRIKPMLVSLVTASILLLFLFLGNVVLDLFGIKPEYFAIAGGFISFLMALEMLMDRVIITSPLEGSGNVIPLAFPLYAGPASFTALISMTADYSVVNLVVAVLANIIVLFLVLYGTNWIARYVNKNVLYIIQKFFGIIVLAIAVQLMFGNFVKVFHLG